MDQVELVCSVGSEHRHEFPAVDRQIQGPEHREKAWQREANWQEPDFLRAQGSLGNSEVNVKHALEIHSVSHLSPEHMGHLHSHCHLV
jgi:hypothetical protein